jgi:molybdopterin-guanine dinucleotide biosynthesis protein
MDLFNAWGQAQSPFLQVKTEELREKNENAFKYQMSGYGTEWKLAAENTAFDDNYRKKLDEFTAERFKNMRAANTSPYYQKLIANAEQQALQANEAMTLQKESDYKKETRAVDFEKQTSLYLDSIGTDTNPEFIKQQMDIAFNILKTGGGELDPAINFSPEKEYEIKQGLYTRLHQKYVSAVLSQVNDTKFLEDAQKRINERFAEFMPKTEMPDGERKNWTPNAEWDKAALQEHTNRIHKKNEDEIRAADAQYRKLMEQDAAAGGNTTFKTRADTIAKPYRDGVQKRLKEAGGFEKETEYADSFKDAIPFLFDGDGGGSRSRSGSEKPLDMDSIHHAALALTEGVITGTAGISYNELWGSEESTAKALIKYIEIMAEKGDTQHQKNLRWIQENGEQAFITKTGFDVLSHPEIYLKRLVENHAPAAQYLSNDALKVIKAQAKNHAKFGKKGMELNEAQSEYLVSLIRDVASEDNDGLSDKEYIALIDRELDLIVIEGLPNREGKKVDKTKAKTGNEEEMARKMWQWQEDKNIVHTSGRDERPLYRNQGAEKAAGEWLEQEKSRLEGKAGKGLRFVKHDQEPGAHSDIIVKGVYEDEDGNYYRSRAVSDDEGKTIKIVDEYRPVLADGRKGDWRTLEYGARDGKAADGPAEKPSASEAAKEEALNEAEEKSQFVSNGKKPPYKNGQPFTDWNTFDAQAQYLEDWSKDPDWAPEEIPADEWKSMNQKDRLKKLYGIYGRAQK